MKRLCIALLILTGCGSGLKLSKDIISQEQQRVNNYYTGHVSFRADFYNASDSVFRSLNSNDAKAFAGLYKSIAAVRAGDSSGVYNTADYNSFAKILNSNFTISGGSY